MSDDKSLDIAGIKPVAKAIEAATLKTVDGLGKFFGAICMPAATEVGLLLKDHISEYRQNNLEESRRKLRRKSMTRVSRHPVRQALD